MNGAARLASIQYLRAAAALGVVIYHALQWRAGGFDIGRAGVDIFFVVSGFVLWRATAARPTTPAAFLVDRGRRILPAYWLATLVAAAIAALAPAFMPQVRPGFSHLLLSLALVPHFDPRGLPFPTLPPGWSLCYEAAFYLLFAAALGLPRPWRAGGLIASLFGLAAAGYVLRDPAFVLGANGLVLEFAAGIGIGLFAERGALPSRRWGWAMLLAGLTGFALTQAPGVFVELWRPLLWGAPAALVVAGAAAIEAAAGARRWPPGLALGDASYALYLVHLPLVALAAHALAAADTTFFLPVALAISVLGALAVHRWVERPLAFSLKGRRIEKPYRSDGFNRLDAMEARG